MKKITTILSILIFNSIALGQELALNETKFSQPLFLDLPGDLNVKKGYKEMNVLGSFQNFNEFKYYRASAEFAFAPINNLSIEIETPFNFYSKPQNSENKVEALRIGGMYSIPKLNIEDFALSVGFYNDFELSTFHEFGKPLFEANAFQPFVGIAKVWGKKITTLATFGGNFHHNYEHNHNTNDIRFNANFGYQLDNKNTFLNIETNSTIYKGKWHTYIRPQARFILLEKWSLGLGSTIPTEKGEKGFGAFFRVSFNP